jgi:2-oxoglutarate ferredoxin oxidoreductase subunit alpha
VEDLPEIPVTFAKDPKNFQPYARDPKTLARAWAVPGTPGLEHRVGGLEKDFLTGNISYDPENHDRMVKIRTEKIARIVDDIPPAEVEGEPKGKLLVVGWGSTYGAIKSALAEARTRGHSASHLHLRYINPLPGNVGEILRSFDRILVPEINNGQLSRILREHFLVETIGFNKVRGLPLSAEEVTNAVIAVLGGNHA